VIAPCAGALWVGLTMAAAGDPWPATPTSAAATALSAHPIVAVRRPSPGDTVLEAAGSRIRSELAAMGLEGQFVDCPPTETDPGTCPDATATATIALARRDDGVVEIGVRTIQPDGLELSRHVRVLARDGGDDPAVLGVRAVELLRDLLLTGQRPAARGPARDDEEPKLPPPPPVPPRWRLSIGVALLGSPAGDQPGVSPAVGPTIAAGGVIGSSVSVIASLAGPFDTSLGPINGRRAALVQALATVELHFRLKLDPLEPFVAVLTGVNYLKATIPGSTIPGSSTVDPSNSSAWVPLFGVGIGVAPRLGTRFYLCLEAEVFVTQPDMLVYIDGEVAGSTGAPSVLLTSGLGLTLP